MSFIRGRASSERFPGGATLMNHSSPVREPRHCVTPRWRAILEKAIPTCGNCITHSRGRWLDSTSLGLSGCLDGMPWPAAGGLHDFSERFKSIRRQLIDRKEMNGRGRYVCHRRYAGLADEFTTCQRSVYNTQGLGKRLARVLFSVTCFK